MLNSNIFPTRPYNMVNFGPLTAEVRWRVWVTPSKFQRVSRLGSVTAWHSSSGCQPNFAALNRGRHLYSTGRPSRWALAHILVHLESMSSLVLIMLKQQFSACNKLLYHRVSTSADYSITTYMVDQKTGATAHIF